VRTGERAHDGTILLLRSPLVAMAGAHCCAVRDKEGEWKKWVRVQGEWLRQGVLIRQKC
jgi:hypothetical protein